MMNITNVTNARKNLSTLVKNLKKPTIIVQNSVPKAVLVPYDVFVENEEKEFKNMTRIVDFLEEGDEEDEYSEKDIIEKLV